MSSDLNNCLDFHTAPELFLPTRSFSVAQVHRDRTVSISMRENTFGMYLSREITVLSASLFSASFSGNHDKNRPELWIFPLNNMNAKSIEHKSR